ncbi:uncharacterized protein LOC143453251 [Clavelina lepadiformis]|uniref:uncharacterized protein LOC143453251 n=1 Tax=Clavelina lepadiformis TaxID=159417 RepID=UPI0040415B4F
MARRSWLTSLVMVGLACFKAMKCDLFSCNEGCSNFDITPAKQCNVERISKRPRPKSNEITAPAPKWLNVSLYIYKKNTGVYSVALNITWSQDGNEIGRNITGYYLTMRKLGSSSFQMKFTFDSGASAATAFFNYACFGMAENEEIIPGSIYTMRLMTMPLFYVQGEPLYVRRKIYIPECYHKDMSKTAYCAEPEERYDDYDNSGIEDYYDIENINPQKPYNKPESPTVIIIVAIVGLFFVIVVIILACAFVKKRYEKSNDVLGYKSVMLLVFQSEKNPLHFDICSCIASMLKAHGGLKVSFNLWNMSTMGDSIQWFDNNKNCENIVLVCTPPANKPCDDYTADAEKDPFMLGLTKFKNDCQRTSLQWARKCAFSYIYFGSRNENSIPDIIKQHRSKIIGYEMGQDFEKFFHQTTGKDPDIIPKTEIQYLFDALSNLNKASTISLSSSDGCSTTSTVTTPLLTSYEDGARYNSTVL